MLVGIICGLIGEPSSGPKSLDTMDPPCDVLVRADRLVSLGVRKGSPNKFLNSKSMIDAVVVQQANTKGLGLVA